MGWESPGTIAFIVEYPAMTVGSDMKVTHPELSILSLHEGLGKTEVGGFDGFQFG